jgi:hypothetical protein
MQEHVVQVFYRELDRQLHQGGMARYNEVIPFFLFFIYKLYNYFASLFYVFHLNAAYFYLFYLILNFVNILKNKAKIHFHYCIFTINKHQEKFFIIHIKKLFAAK